MVAAFTRPVAFVLAGEMAVLYCFLFLYLGAVGGGPWSLDALRERPPNPPRT